VPGWGSVSLKFAFRLTLTEKYRPSEIEETGPPRLSKSDPRADIGGPEHHPVYDFFIFIHFLAISYDLFFFIFSWAEVAQYESSYHQTAHHAPG